MRVVKHWHRLVAQRVADAPPLETFEVRLGGGVLNNLIQLKKSLLIAGELDCKTL